MIVGIVKIGPGIVPLEEFRKGTSTVEAVAEFCGEHTPPLAGADYLGIDPGWTAPMPKLRRQWGYGFDVSALVEIVIVDP